MKRLSLILVALAAPAAAQAQDDPICTDRPARANAVCTVPPGRFQIETSLAGWSLTEAAGTRTELLSLAPSVVKIGLTERSDLQIGFTPFAQLTSRAPGSVSRISGFGDVTARYKHRLTGPDAAVQIGVIPSVKIPTARSGLGNDWIEGGVAVPISFPLGGLVTMTLGPELNLLADADGSGRHPALVGLVNLSMPIAPRWTVAGELWTSFNFDPAGTVRQASLDGALAYSLSTNLQLDAGANLGLTRATAGIEFYTGISFRF